MNKEELPPILYKYRTWSNEHHKQMLTHNEIWFAEPQSFNDPFDCTIPVRYEDLTVIERIEHFMKGLPKAFPSQSGDENAQEAIQWAKMWDEPGTPGRFAEAKMKMLNEIYGMFTASSTRENILMWSHYADYHRGMTVGFHTERMMSSLASGRDRSGLDFRLDSVEYCHDYPLLRPDKVADEGWFSEQFLVKSEQWSYEKEYRATLIGPPKILEKERKQVLDSEVIAEVILGCRMPEEHKDQIFDILKKRASHVRLLQAVQSKTQFALGFEAIEY